jgi:hypothetical protein
LRKCFSRCDSEWEERKKILPRYSSSLCQSEL